MQVYWIKAQAPLRVLALCKHIGLKAEFIQLDPGSRLMQLQAWAGPWPASRKN